MASPINFASERTRVGGDEGPSDRPDSGALDRLARLVAQLLHAPASLVSFIEADYLVVQSSFGLPPPWDSRPQIPLNETICQYLLPGEPLVISDARRDPRLADTVAVRDLGITSYLGLPVVTSQGVRLWSLCVIDFEPREWSQAEIRSLYDLAQSMVTEIELRAEIAARQQIEEELRRSAQRDQLQARLLEMVGQAVIAVDLEGRIFFWNSAAEQLYGWSGEEALGNHASMLVPEDARSTAATITECLGRGESWTGELWVQRQDGSRVPVLVTDTPIRDALGQPMGFIGVSTDISSQKRAEATLRERDEYIRLVLRQVPCMLWSTDRDLRFTLGVGSDTEVGGDPDQAVGRSLSDYFGTDEPDFPPLNAHRRALQGERVSYEAEWGGRVFQSQVQPLRAPDGSVIGTSGVALDITEQKAAAEALRISEAKFRSVFEAAEIGIATVGPGGILIESNPALEKMLGYSSGELPGKLIADLTHPDDVAASEVLIDELLAGTHPSVQAENRCIRKDGSIIWGHLTASVLRNSSGDPQTVLGLIEDMTTRKQNEAELREATHRVTTILESITDAFITLDHSWRFTYVNPEAERLLCRSRAELMGSDIWEEFAEAIPRRSYFEYHRAIRENVAVHFDDFYPPLAAWFEVHAYPSPAGLAIYFRDVTQRREAEQALRASEEQFRAIFDHAAIGIALIDRLGHAVETNVAFQWMLGYTATELRARTFPEFTHPDDIAQNWKLFQELLAGQRTSYECEKRFCHRDGHVLYGRIVASLVRDAAGEPLFVVEMTENITERTLAQEEKDRLFTFSLDLLCVIGFDGYLKRINPAFQKSLGYSENELLSRPFVEFAHREDRDATMAEMEKLGTGQPTLYFENRYRCADGACKWLAWTAVPNMDQEQIYGVARDMTPQKETEAALLQAQAQLVQAQKMEAVGRLAGGVAHDFNNMLAVIIGYSDMLLSRRDLDLTMRTSLTEVKKAGERAASLTGQLLAFSRKSLMTQQPMDLNDVITGMQQMLHRLIGEDIELKVELEPGLGNIRADRGQMDQVVMNLAVNARDAMATSGTLTIQTTGMILDAAATHGKAGLMPGEFIVLTVSDTGRGMDPSTVEHIWEPFFSTKGDLGTGLGLSTVYGIIVQSGGYVEIESEPERGTTFRIFFPRIEQECETAPTDDALSTPARHSETILLVEDEEMVRTLVRNVLRASGYHLLEARNGDQAVQVLNDHPGLISLLLTDVVMPGGMSGRELAEHVRGVRPEVKVLYMTGYTDDAVVRNGVNTEGMALIQKPFTPARLMQKVSEVLC